MGNDNPSWHKQNQSAKEFSAQENVPQSVNTLVTVGPGGFEIPTHFSNSSGETVIVEFATVDSDPVISNQLLVRLFHEDPDTANQRWEFDAPLTQYPVYADPGVAVPDGDNIILSVTNGTGLETELNVRTTQRTV